MKISIGLSSASNREAEVRSLSRQDRIFAAISFVLAFLFSMWILPYYVAGDQTHYREYYRNLPNIPLSDLLEYQYRALGATEPFYAITMWVGSNAGIDKDLYISCINSMLILFMFIAFRKYSVPYSIVFLCFANFYTIVLLTSAERLKFGYLIFFLAICLNGYKKKFVFLASILGHLQMSINLSSLAAISLSGVRLRRHLGKNAAISLVFTLPALALASTYFIATFYNIALEKFGGYSSQFFSTSNISLLLVLTAIGIAVAPNKRQMAFGMLPILVAVLFLGGFRVNMIGFVMWCFLMIAGGRSNHIALYGSLIYFAFKSFPYLFSILQFGDGFVAL